MATIKHVIETTFLNDELKLRAPVEYIEFNEQLGDCISVKKGLFGEKFYLYKDDKGNEFILPEADKEMIDSLWARNSGPLRIYKRTENRLGQKGFECHEGHMYDCSKCPNILPFERFGGTEGLYYCTQCKEDKWNENRQICF